VRHQAPNICSKNMDMDQNTKELLRDQCFRKTYNAAWTLNDDSNSVHAMPVAAECVYGGQVTGNQLTASPPCTG
jgi:hypothetical protein